jgi:hypothetical protein
MSERTTLDTSHLLPSCAPLDVGGCESAPVVYIQ